MEGWQEKDVRTEALQTYLKGYGEASVSINDCN